MIGENKASKAHERLALQSHFSSKSFPLSHQASSPSSLCIFFFFLCLSLSKKQGRHLSLSPSRSNDSGDQSQPLHPTTSSPNSPPHPQKLSLHLRRSLAEQFLRLQLDRDRSNAISGHHRPLFPTRQRPEEPP